MNMGRNLLGLALVALLCGCATGQRNASQYIDDQMTSRKITDSLFEHPTYKFEDVDVKTYRGVVQLSGYVAQPEQKDTALHIARRTPGVLDVLNNISVKPQAH